MNTKEQADQLRLAADILETEHPWEHESPIHGWQKSSFPLTELVSAGAKFRIILATPPDSRWLHNPDNLTADQVGVGYRLCLKGEQTNLQTEKQEFWSAGSWSKSGEVYSSTFDGIPNDRTTYRLPLSVPWPELPDPYAELKAAHAAGKVIQYNPDAPNGKWNIVHIPRFSEPINQYRIKPEPEPEPFQLPPPPPGIEWHDSGWTADMLPQGFRPLHTGEQICKDDEYFAWNEGPWKKTQDCQAGDRSGDHIGGMDVKYRTTRPLTFTHEGKEWTWHKAGDPMPCLEDALIETLFDDGSGSEGRAGVWMWSNSQNIPIGWRYAEPATKTADLGPEDMPPGSVFQRKEYAGTAQGIVTPLTWFTKCLEFHDSSKTYQVTFAELREEFNVNRSIPLTGKWNPDAWEPCHKQIPA